MNPSGGAVESYWNEKEMPPPFPKEEVRRAVRLEGDCRIPQIWRPIPLLFRNEALYDFFGLWPNDVWPVKDYGLDPRRMFALAMERRIPLHGGSTVEHFLRDVFDARERFSEFFVEPSEAWRESLASQVEAAPERYHTALHIGLLFEPLYVLWGMERYLMDLIEHRRESEELLERLLGFQISTARIYAEAGCDAILTSDDWGSQQSLLIDPALWRSMFKPRYRRFVEAAHELGLDVIFHSDGNLDSIFPDLVDIGFDVLNPLQPGAMDVDRWRREYRGRIGFYTGVDVQGMLPFAEPEEVRREVRKAIAQFRHESGGLLIGSTNAVTAEVPFANLAALYETLMEYR